MNRENEDLNLWIEMGEEAKKNKKASFQLNGKKLLIGYAEKISILTCSPGCPG
ncbi:hypothetical protein RM553_09670 [Zunongwangia sp. F363]|uniref:Uncharacterized protein n=1 Tax=Autumnicola tepida TaxID=3075595 RepID=A0ABU3C9U7_9FLAO|nr:hypothetical protein [Zunongwangia sp. F363]MDT0643094.1 hypothetical protein [Zunongwangia sp. F363]